MMDARERKTICSVPRPTFSAYFYDGALSELGMHGVGFCQATFMNGKPPGAR